MDESAVKRMDRLKDFASRLSLMMSEAHGLMLNATGHAIHEAVRKVGYEIPEAAERLARRDRSC